MAKQKLNFRFYNPNTVGATADNLLKIMVDVNSDKLDQAIQLEMASEDEKHKQEA